MIRRARGRGKIPTLSIILAESALERIPTELWNHHAIKKHAKRKGKKPGEILLDRSYHHTAMLNLKHAKKRGRPDIVHFSLLEALGSPLNKEGYLRVYVHTFDDYVIMVDPSIRLPRNYDRFVGLIEQLFETGKVPPKGKTLLSLRKQTIGELISDISPTRVIAFSREGKGTLLEDIMEEMAREEGPLIIIGGFARGDFSEELKRLISEFIAIDLDVLEAWVVVSRVIYAYERAISLPRKRLRRLLKSNRF